MGEASNGKVPQSVKYAIIGAGIHGLSTAFHLAQMLKKTGRGSGEDILVVDKTAIAAGASGIACGVVRNNYFQPAMRELMAHSVDVWESDAETYSLSSCRLHADQPRMHARGCRLDLRAAEGDRLRVRVHRGCRGLSEHYMKGLFDDWQAKGITSVLHEKRGGYANNTGKHATALPPRPEAEGVRILTGVEVTGFEFGSNSGAVTALNTNQGRIACDTSWSARAPGSTRSGTCSSCRSAITVKGRDGKVHDDVPMWKFWCLEEGTLGVDPEHAQDQ